MQKGQFLLNKSLLLLLFITVSLSTVFISCCKNKKSNDPSCVKFSKAQLQKWVNKGYTDSTNKNYIAIVQFKADYAFPGTGFRVYAMGIRKDGTAIEESLVELSADDTCKKDHIKLSRHIFTGTNTADWSQMGVINMKGQLNDSLKYLQLTPYSFGYTCGGTKFNFLAYEFNVVKSDGSVTKPIPTTRAAGGGGGGLPCPPCQYCPNPCPPPDGCVSPCSPAATESL